MDKKTQKKATKAVKKTVKRAAKKHPGLVIAVIILVLIIIAVGVILYFKVPQIHDAVNGCPVRIRRRTRSPTEKDRCRTALS